MRKAIQNANIPEEIDDSVQRPFAFIHLAGEWHFLDVFFPDILLTLVPTWEILRWPYPNSFSTNEIIDLRTPLYRVFLLSTWWTFCHRVSSSVHRYHDSIFRSTRTSNLLFEDDFIQLITFSKASLRKRAFSGDVMNRVSLFCSSDLGNCINEESSKDCRSCLLCDQERDTFRLLSRELVLTCRNVSTLVPSLLSNSHYRVRTSSTCLVANGERKNGRRRSWQTCITWQPAEDQFSPLLTSMCKNTWSSHVPSFDQTRIIEQNRIDRDGSDLFLMGQ